MSCSQSSIVSYRLSRVLSLTNENADCKWKLSTKFFYVNSLTKAVLLHLIENNVVGCKLLTINNTKERFSGKWKTNLCSQINYTLECTKLSFETSRKKSILNNDKWNLASLICLVPRVPSCRIVYGSCCVFFFRQRFFAQVYTDLYQKHGINNTSYFRPQDMIRPGGIITFIQTTSIDEKAPS